MKGYLSLSPKERRYQLLYLSLMLLLALVFLSVLFLRKFNSPFSSKDVLEIQMLAQKNKFSAQQKIVEPLLESTYTKISILSLQTPQPFAESDIKTNINEIANAFMNVEIFDTRKEAYGQIAQFYKMFFDDKKIAAKRSENIALFQKQYEECSIGFKDKEQQLMQKKNAMLARSGQ